MPILVRLAPSPFSSYEGERLGMKLLENPFKRRLLAKELQIGLWCSLCSNISAEIVSDSGFDWALLDTEHAPNELPTILGQLQAMAQGTLRQRSCVRPGTIRS